MKFYTLKRKEDVKGAEEPILYFSDNKDSHVFLLQIPIRNDGYWNTFRMQKNGRFEIFCKLKDKDDLKHFLRTLVGIPEEQEMMFYLKYGFPE